MEELILPSQLKLVELPEGLTLTDGRLFLRADFEHMQSRIISEKWRHELLVKAAKTKQDSPLAIDATAGFGEDSLLLATAGFQVHLYEKNPVIAALLRDALQRAAQTPGLSDVVSRMTLFTEDSLEGFEKYSAASPSVIYLDPMFPERQKSGLIKKKFQLLQQLEQPCTDQDADALFQAAAAVRPGKIVVKRPLKGPLLANARPSYSLKGRAIRYDIYQIS
jgi:16S rRNA (guanine1516-N2)-methyltransferase